MRRYIRLFSVGFSPSSPVQKKPVDIKPFFGILRPVSPVKLVSQLSLNRGTKPKFVIKR
jgi:hypothetical protein